MIFHFFLIHVGRSLLEGLQRGNWLSVHLFLLFWFRKLLARTCWLVKQSTTDSSAGNRTDKLPVMITCCHPQSGLKRLGSSVNLCRSSDNKLCVWRTHTDWMILTTAVVWTAACIIKAGSALSQHSVVWRLTRQVLVIFLFSFFSLSCFSWFCFQTFVYFSFLLFYVFVTPPLPLV